MLLRIMKMKAKELKLEEQRYLVLQLDALNCPAFPTNEDAVDCLNYSNSLNLLNFQDFSNLRDFSNLANCPNSLNLLNFRDFLNYPIISSIPMSLPVAVGDFVKLSNLKLKVKLPLLTHSSYIIHFIILASTKIDLEKGIVETLKLLQNQPIILDELRRVIDVKVAFLQTRSADEGETLISDNVYQ